MSIIKSIKTLILPAIAFLSIHEIAAQQSDPPFLKYMNHPWVDSVMKTLTIDQQIAQCIWIAGYSNMDVSHEVEVSDIIRKYGVGGIVFFQGTAAKQAELTNYYQKISKVPLLISLDAEWGVGMRIENVDKFPYQMTLGAIQNDSLIYQFGKAVASQLKRLGIQMNFAPVLDINVNAQNPVINYRSFGENREKVTSKSIMYMKGLQDNGILATGKHFPGHGDTNVDSHLELPLINHSRTRLDSVELYPFRKLIGEGIGSIMVAHLNLPQLDTTTGLPSTLSHVIINDLLKNELGFRGLVVTDAMMMKAVTKYFKPGEADAKALEAGNDVAEFVTDVEATIRETRNYISSKKLTYDDMALKCRKVLALKYWSGLNMIQTIYKENIDNELSPMTSKVLIRELYANALTVLNNNQDILPVKNLKNIKIATIAINRRCLCTFQKRITDYYPADHFFIDPSDSAACNKLLKKLSEYNIVIAGVFGLDQRPNLGFGIKPGLNNFLEKLIVNNKTIITWFGSPYGIDKLKILRNANGLILAYQENEYTEDLSAQLVFGGIGARGLLPVTINDKWPSDFGIITPGNLRLQYGLPESVGMSSEILNTKIDSIVDAGLTAKAFPGCVVMAARKGVVVFLKAYGFQTYDNRIAVREDDIYDLASVTKISSTLAGLMLLNTEGKFSPDKTLGFYLPDFKKTNKGKIVMRDFLTHQAGLIPYIPFWKETIKKNGKFRHNIFDYQYDKKYSLEVAQGLYINKNYTKKMFNEIKKSPLGEKKYVYSDLTFIIAPEIIEKLAGEKWYDYVTDSIYKKIGAFEMGFNPYKKFPLSRIVPTEYDSLFRKQLLHGTVHDEAAAMLGGISGHAGLFSTANDLMKLMELYRRMGEYGGEQLIGKDVIKEYTRVQFPENNNRRGLGFDKPLLNNSELSQKDSYPAKSASPASFGHSGYTGTFVWVDPAYDITYVFLCNRVYPTRKNEELYNMNIRSQILQAIYDSIKK
ncbi:MAG: glycoside hydrolase family 3 N-terminal domain-containing protein [Bacteroidales bacterium]|jgi:beta-glucosidase-like glycosyl hydrolase/CubicO group peptidase (beta-lactamase class C family)